MTEMVATPVNTGEMPNNSAGVTPAPAVETPNVETLESVKAELERVRKALKESNQDAASKRKKLETFEAEEQKRKEAEMTELQKIQAANEELSNKLKGFELAEMRRKAAEAAGLPSALAGRITGDTLEAMTEDAKQLAALIPKPNIPPTNVGAQEPRTTEAEQRARVYGAPVNMFDKSLQAQLGGGVYFTDKSEK